MKDTRPPPPKASWGLCINPKCPGHDRDHRGQIVRHMVFNTTARSFLLEAAMRRRDARWAPSCPSCSLTPADVAARAYIMALAGTTPLPGMGGAVAQLQGNGGPSQPPSAP